MYLLECDNDQIISLRVLNLLSFLPSTPSTN